MRVLVIGDNQQLFSKISSHLAKRGFIVDAAETLAAGLKKAAEAVHEVILLDLSLADEDDIKSVPSCRHQH